MRKVKFVWFSFVVILTGCSFTQGSSSSVSSLPSDSSIETSMGGSFVGNVNQIDTSVYGSDVDVRFYVPDLSNDPYANVDKTAFYANYQPATSYEDAYFRTQHHLLSGEDIQLSDYYIPFTSALPNHDDGIDYRIQTGRYILDENGNYLAYMMYTQDELSGNMDNSHYIYYGGAYTSMEEVAAYLLAFGEVPPNSNYDKSRQQYQSIEDWGVYGRVNNDYFSGDTGNYPYEPLLPNLDTVSYTETDFGTTGYEMNSWTSNYQAEPYNTGDSINRGAARFIFVSGTSTTNIDQRHVFYTYNHYNDVQEYLNYEYGWATRYGSQSAGNEYVSGTKDWNNYASYYGVDPAEPTAYPGYTFIDFSDL